MFDFPFHYGKRMVTSSLLVYSNLCVHCFPCRTYTLSILALVVLWLLMLKKWLEPWWRTNGLIIIPLSVCAFILYLYIMSVKKKSKVRCMETMNRFILCCKLVSCFEASRTLFHSLGEDYGLTMWGLTTYWKISVAINDQFSCYVIPFTFLA